MSVLIKGLKMPKKGLVEIIISPDGKAYVLARPLIDTEHAEVSEIYDTTELPDQNADRIRTMTDKELAEYHAEKCGCPHDPIVFGCRMATIGCVGCWLDWLKQEVERSEDE